jgi:hypothetical protein
MCPRQMCLNLRSSLDHASLVWPVPLDDNSLNEVSWTGSFSPEISQLAPLSELSPATSPFPMESAVSLADCVPIPQRLMYRVPARTGILPSLASADGGWGWGCLICTYMERSIPPDFVWVWVAQLWVSGNSSYWYIAHVHNILPPAGVNNLVDSCSFSVTTIVG